MRSRLVTEVTSNAVLATLRPTAVAGAASRLFTRLRGRASASARSIRIKESPPAATRNVTALTDGPNPPSMRLSADAKWRLHRHQRLVTGRARLRRNEGEAAAFPIVAVAQSE